MYLFLETGKGGRKKETHQCVVASLTLPTGHLAHNPVLAGNRISNPLVLRLALNPLSPIGQGVFNLN